MIPRQSVVSTRIFRAFLCHFSSFLLVVMIAVGNTTRQTDAAAVAGSVYLPLIRNLGTSVAGIVDEIPGAISASETMLEPGPMAIPAGSMLNVKTYGAIGDGSSDDTAAIQRALDDTRVGADGKPLYPVPDQYNGRPRALFFPAGTYLVSKTLSWVGCCMTIQGQGAGATTIRLKPNTSGFNDASKPQPVIRTENGNMSFRQNIWDMAIVVGSGNPGAIGLDYVSNNSGALRNVQIKAEDGRGVCGLELMRNWPGPNMFSQVQIEGFDYGIRVQFIEYSQTYENIVLKNQRVAGILNNGAVMAMRGLYSLNRVPAIVFSGEHGLVTLLDARLEGGAATNSAIEVNSANKQVLYLRNATANGYESLLKNGAVVPGLRVGEYYSGQTYSLFNTSTALPMLKLPVRNTPRFNDPNLTNWATATCNGYVGCQLKDELQKLLDSGKSTLAFPFGVRIVYDELTVTVPASIKRIVGFTSVFNGGGKNGGGVKFVVAGDSSEPLIIEQFGYGVKVEHQGKRPVVLKYGVFEYTAKPGAGDVYAEDAQMDGFTLQAGQHLWGRQINNEFREGTKITNDGGVVWILGMKTEGSFTVLDTRNGGSSEYLGGLIYPATDRLQPGEIAFKASGGARLALLYSNITYTTRNYDLQVEELRGSDRRQLLTSAAPERTRLYISGP